MITNNEIKYLRSLQQKKFRDEEKVFVVEGTRMVEEAIESDLTVRNILSTENWDDPYTDSGARIIKKKDMERISRSKSAPPVLAVVDQPHYQLDPASLTGKFTIVLEGVSDPGNLGTIIRTADHFGIENIICSKGSVEAFNPKTIQASMGAILRVQVHYCELSETLPAIIKEHDIPILATQKEGENLYTAALPDQGLLLMGSEAHGLSEELVEALICRPISIPSFGKAESLNVAIATAICCSELRRSEWTNS